MGGWGQLALWNPTSATVVSSPYRCITDWLGAHLEVTVAGDWSSQEIGMHINSLEIRAIFFTCTAFWDKIIGHLLC